MLILFSGLLLALILYLIDLLLLPVIIYPFLLESFLDGHGRHSGNQAGDSVAIAATKVTVVVRMLGLIARSIIIIAATILNTQVLTWHSPGREARRGKRRRGSARGHRRA